MLERADGDNKPRAFLLTTIEESSDRLYCICHTSADTWLVIEAKYQVTPGLIILQHNPDDRLPGLWVPVPEENL